MYIARLRSDRPVGFRPQMQQNYSLLILNFSPILTLLRSELYF